MDFDLSSAAGQVSAIGITAMVALGIVIIIIFSVKW